MSIRRSDLLASAAIFLAAAVAVAVGAWWLALVMVLAWVIAFGLRRA